MKDIERIEAIANEFDKMLFEENLEHDSWLQLQTKNRDCSCHIDDKGMRDWLREKLEEYGAEREQAGRDMAVDYMFKELPTSMRPTEAILQEARSIQSTKV
jgi:hypothetical protein